jgi:hypothetical protein
MSFCQAWFEVQKQLLIGKVVTVDMVSEDYNVGFGGMWPTEEGAPQG